MTPRNCLSHALDRWHTDGGYLVLRKSSARAWPHVMIVTDQGLQHFAPGAPLGHPVHALVGYDGVVWDRELSDAPPVPLRGIVIGAVLLLVGACGWALGRMIRGRANG